MEQEFKVEVTNVLEEVKRLKSIADDERQFYFDSPFCDGEVNAYSKVIELLEGVLNG